MPVPLPHTQRAAATRTSPSALSTTLAVQKCWAVDASVNSAPISRDAEAGARRRIRLPAARALAGRPQVKTQRGRRDAKAERGDRHRYELRENTVRF